MAWTIFYFLVFSTLILVANASGQNRKLPKSSPTVAKLLNAYKEFEPQFHLQIEQALVMIDK